jgi:hypothetical protein
MTRMLASSHTVLSNHLIAASIARSEKFPHVRTIFPGRNTTSLRLEQEAYVFCDPPYCP